MPPVAIRHCLLVCASNTTLDPTQANVLSLSDPWNRVTVTVKQTHQPRVAEVLRVHHQVAADGTLLCVDFTTLNDYLHLLKGAAQSLDVCGRRAMFYLAAAVSDFYIPPDQMVRRQHFQHTSLKVLLVSPIEILLSS